MPTTPDELRSRWYTKDGKQRTDALIKAMMSRDWESILEGFPHVQEVPNGRDLRYAQIGGADLVGAHLEDADLSHAILWSADLRGAWLTGANLREASLNNADLSIHYDQGVDPWPALLQGARLDGADLGLANLYGSVLLDVNLQRSYLRQTNFTRAHLKGADLSEARCEGTVFADVDLSETKGLELTQHSGPSTLGIDTLYRSLGAIPKTFLRGCGVPEILIENLSSLVVNVSGSEFHSCFISYSHKEEEFARYLYSQMQAKGLRVWFAPEDIKGGRKLHEQIELAIRIYDKLVIVLSERSMESEWVKTEIRKARQQELQEGRRKLFPIRLVDFDTIRAWKCFDADSGRDLAVEVREYFIPNFSNWQDDTAFNEAFQRLLRDLSTDNTEMAEG